MTEPTVVLVHVRIPATLNGAANKKITAFSKPKSHPSTGEMVNAAIAALKDRKGASLQGIKKYIASTYQLDPKKHSYFIKKYLKSAIEKQRIVQVKGIGASGRFKLSSENEKMKKVASKKILKSSSKAKAKAKAPTVVKPKSPKPKKDIVHKIQSVEK